ncbi:serine hydrolase domain-containing protein [Solicola gregarius]|uniref:serine hydrolase domain-containing protein n=1 Tax=Solicola gregarius TaxID=2908642 RepID=UPI0038CDC706
MPAQAADEADTARFDRVDDYLDAYADQNDIPGVVAAVIGPDGTEHEYAYGTDGDGDEVDTETPFLIGSVAKTMTATIVMQLESKGKLALSDHVSEHIDFLPEGDPTIEQLLTHTAGFTGADGIAVADRYDNEPGAIRRAVESLEHSGTVGEYAYTSADFLVLGAIVESVTGRPYEEVLESDLLEPLGMTRSSASAEAAAELPPGHRLWWGRAAGYDPPFDESGTPYASVISTLADVETYATAQLRGEAISSDIRENMQRPRVESSDDHYGLGWSVTDDDGERIVHHTGATPGFFVHVLLVPDRQSAVVILTNVYSEAAAPSLAAGAEDVWRIVDGDSRTPAGSDPVLGAMPWVLSGIALFGLALAVLSLWRPVRRRGRIIAAAVSLVVVVGLWLLPGLVGYDLRALRIWAPDAAWSLIAALALWAIAAIGWLLPRFVRGAEGGTRTLTPEGTGT